MQGLLRLRTQVVCLYGKISPIRYFSPVMGTVRVFLLSPVVGSLLSRAVHLGTRLRRSCYGKLTLKVTLALREGSASTIES